MTLLVTSRERLGTPDEWVYDLAGLSYPTGAASANPEGYRAVELFVQRARQARRQFVLAGEDVAAVVRICRMVEGLPLAIELAAAGLRAQTATAIADALETGISMLPVEHRAITKRHRSIAATFEHSWLLLTDEQRRVFARLSVFRGGFDEAAAADVAQATPQLLMALVDKSLLRWDGTGSYDVHELLRQSGEQKLKAEKCEDEIRRRHARYYAELAEAVEPRLYSPARVAGMARLEHDHGNLRTGLSWTVVAPNASQLGSRLITALCSFWLGRNHLRERRAWAEQMLRRSDGDDTSRGCVAYVAGLLAWWLLDLPAAHMLLDQSIGYLRIAVARHWLTYALRIRGIVLCDSGDTSAGTALCVESVMLAREQGDTWGLAHGLYLLGNALFKQGSLVEAQPIYSERLHLWRECGDPWGMSLPLSRLGEIAISNGDYDGARVLLEESVALRRAIGDTLLVTMALDRLTQLAIRQGDYDRASAYLLECLRLRQIAGPSLGLGETLELCSWLAHVRGQPRQAVRLWAAAQSYRASIVLVRRPHELVSDKHISDARATLSPATFTAAWESGQALTLEQAIAYALETSDGDMLAFNSDLPNGHGWARAGALDK